MGILPSRSLFSLVLSSAENTLFITAVPPPIWKLNLPSVLSVGNVTLLLDSCNLAAASAELALPCEPEVLSNATEPSGTLPSLKLFSFVLSVPENTS